MTKVSNKGVLCSKTSKEGVDPRLRGGILCSEEVLDESPTSANLENDHGFIIKE